MQSYKVKRALSLGGVIAWGLVLLAACSRETLMEGFEQAKFDAWKSGWHHHLERVDLTLNTNSKYVSQGNASLKCAIVTSGERKDHYGGVKVPLNQSHLTFDMWLETPESVTSVWVYMYDEKGKHIAGWNRVLSRQPMKAGEKYTIRLSHGTSGSDFDFMGGTEGQPSWVDIFVLSEQENVPITFYIDNFRTR